jgi:hypothetical protein
MLNINTLIKLNTNKKSLCCACEIPVNTKIEIIGIKNKRKKEYYIKYKNKYVHSINLKNEDYTIINN